MTTPKFLDIFANGGSITVNKENIATFEYTGNGAKIRLNITDKDGKYIEYNATGLVSDTNNILFKME